MKPIWIWRSQAHGVYEVNSYIITPIVRSAGLTWLHDNSFMGLLWQFPEAVEVKNPATGTHTRLPIPDPTRTIVWFLVALALLVVAIAATARWRRGRLSTR